MYLAAIRHIPQFNLHVNIYCQGFYMSGHVEEAPRIQ